MPLDPNEVFPVANEPPEDMEQYNAWREAGGGTQATDEPAEPAATSAEDENQPSEPVEEEVSQESQTATESETAEVTEQEEEEEVDPEEPAAVAKPQKGLSKRMRELTGEIKSLKAELAELHQPEVDDDGAAEVVSATEPEAEAEAIAPKLSDYEDTEELSQWDQYEAASRAFNKAEMAKEIAKALANQTQQTELRLAKAQADATWAKASERYSDYNEIVKDDGSTRVSPAMISVVKTELDAESGTDVAYYLATHKEEATKLADSTMANNLEEWNAARVRVAVKFGEIRAKIAAEKAVKGAPKPAAPKVPPVLKTNPKTVTTAPKPPTQVGRTAPTVKSDILTNPGDDDFNLWEKARNAELAKTGRR